MKFQFNKHFYRYSAFYSMIFWTCFFLSDILIDPSQTPAWYSLLACLIIFINAIRVFFFKEEKELTRMGLHLLYRIDCSDCLSEIYFG